MLSAIVNALSALRISNLAATSVRPASFARVVSLGVGLLLSAPRRSAADSGHVKLLTYNVAGLPDGFSTPHPSQNMGPISRRLKGFDIVLVQEDYAYAASLRQFLELPHQSPPFERGERWNFGDGLSQFSSWRFSPLSREAWRACHGVVDSYFDCLTPKGFAVAKQELAPGIYVDVYNIHLDAGSTSGDALAREGQVAQLIHAIAARSSGAGVILAGDTNLPAAERPLLERFERETGLADVCTALRCKDPNRIDRVLIRSSASLRLSPKAWRLDRRFVDARGLPLSDHLAVAVDLDWVTVSSLSATPPRSD